ncbi:MAG: 50S ribosomal protein L6 [Candidatus Gracilibacteria bacterium]|nr:50S ribosomal protein L6 [Candidatus Gracilibacteria bacterium]
MSRVGKLPIVLPENVEVILEGSKVTIKGKLGTLSFEFSNMVEIKKEENTLVVTPVSDEANALWGTTRAVLANMVEGVTNGYKKSLEINGVGYKFEVSSPEKLILSVGFSHKVEMIAPKGIKIDAHEKEKNVIIISGIDKQLVGQFASKVRAKKKPEPYKGKGIKYVGEQIRRKAGKTGK